MQHPTVPDPVWLDGYLAAVAERREAEEFERLLAGGSPLDSIPFSEGREAVAGWAERDERRRALFWATSISRQDEISAVDQLKLRAHLDTLFRFYPPESTTIADVAGWDA
jgi:hypothetical protein